MNIHSIDGVDIAPNSIYFVTSIPICSNESWFISNHFLTLIVLITRCLMISNPNFGIIKSIISIINKVKTDGYRHIILIIKSRRNLFFLAVRRSNWLKRWHQFHGRFFEFQKGRVNLFWMPEPWYAISRENGNRIEKKN